jgi:hypothetical protein
MGNSKDIMAQFDKIHEHSLRRFFFDILRDNNSSRYSITKFAALVGLILMTATVVMGLMLMWKTKVVDHVFFLELIGFILTLLGFKNNFGFRATNPTQQPVVAPTVDDNQGRMGDGQKEMVSGVKNPKEDADFVDDSLKG